MSHTSLGLDNRYADTTLQFLLLFKDNRQVLFKYSCGFLARNHAKLLDRNVPPLKLFS